MHCAGLTPLHPARRLRPRVSLWCDVQAQPLSHLPPVSTMPFRPAHIPARALTVLCALVWLCIALPAHAQVGAAAPRPDEQFDVMNLLDEHGLHDMDNERWNAYGQFTYASVWKAPFAAKYTNLNGSVNSLLPEAERSFAGTLTAFMGVRLWPHAEAYFVPEVISERALSNLRGLGGAVQIWELQKTGTETPQIYRSRAYITQTFNFGGEREQLISDPMRLGRVVDARRLVLVLGNFSVLDFIDKNSFAGDLRRQFFNMAFMTHTAYDFASDARGYSWGALAELYWDAWTLRVARMAPPDRPNQLELDLRVGTYYGDQVEIEHRHTLHGKEGAIKLLAYHNRLVTGRFDDAVAAIQADPNKNAAKCQGFNYGSTNASAPDLCWARKPDDKYGVGINLEQHLTDDVGVFLRAMVSDGQTEVYAYTSTDRSLAFGLLAGGTLWHRQNDTFGLAGNFGWISAAHANYLRLGGVDGFIGDGGLRQASEAVGEVFYSVAALSDVWLSADYQLIVNPAFNADRGPVHLFGLRAHAEF